MSLKTAWLLWWVALCTLLGNPNLCVGAKPFHPTFGDPMSEPWRWRTFPELSGLDVQCAAETSDGTMWFGTANGLWSYNGIEWLRHLEVGRIVTSLHAAADGSLYASGGWGISHFSGGKWRQLLSVPTERISNINEIAIKRLIVAPDGTLWAASAWGVLRYSQSAWTLITAAAPPRLNSSPKPFEIELFPPAVSERLQAGTSAADFNEATDLCVDGFGRVWVGTAGGQVLCHTPSPPPTKLMGSWAIYDRADGVLPGNVSAIAAMQDGTVWVIHADADHANILEGTTWKSVRLPLYLPPLDLADVGGRLLQTKDGVIWLAARYFFFTYIDKQWRKYEPTKAFYPSTRNVVLQTRDGAVWFSGPNSEIQRLDYQTRRWLTLEDLNFHCEEPSGKQWFLHRDGRVVVHQSGRWESYGIEDGLPDTPVGILATRSGAIWVAGSHEQMAAMAVFDGHVWKLHSHPQFSFSVEWRGLFESSDGSVWFGAFVDTDGPETHRNGLLQYRNGTWLHHHQPGKCPHPEDVDHTLTLLPPSTSADHPIEKFICIGESRDGQIWAGRNILAFHDGKMWERFIPNPGMKFGSVEVILSSKEGDLWVGTRETGALRYDGSAWRKYQAKEGLHANSVRSLAQTADGTIWAVTDRGANRFDGQTWMEDALPELVQFPHEGGILKASPAGPLWINRFSLHWMRRAWSRSPPPDPTADFRTLCHDFRGEPPETHIETTAGVISQPGNLAVLWSGVMPWRDPKDARLQFSFRLDEDAWSPFTSALGHSFFTLPPGKHRLQVRARDSDFNIDPTPATLAFEVLPPVWRQTWFLLLILLLGGLIAAQTVRVAMEQTRLRRAHDELEVRVRQRTAELQESNRELEAVNRELEAFSYSVSHDLRSPLRSIDGFSKSLLEDYADKLDGEARDDLQRVRHAAQKMGLLIDDMLKLSRVTRGEIRLSPVNLSSLVTEILNDLALTDRARKVRLVVQPDVTAYGDRNLLRIALENLLGNAWKFTSKSESACIEFGVQEEDGNPVYFVRDNGAGFDMAYASRLFGAFNRLHSSNEFPGTGVGLAIVQRVILRHAGTVWARAEVGRGATFFFTVGRRAPGVAGPPLAAEAST